MMARWLHLSLLMVKYGSGTVTAGAFPRDCFVRRQHKMQAEAYVRQPPIPTIKSLDVSSLLYSLVMTLILVIYTCAVHALTIRRV
jgi:hypothetical protein